MTATSRAAAATSFQPITVLTTNNLLKRDGNLRIPIPYRS